MCDGMVSLSVLLQTERERGGGGGGGIEKNIELEGKKENNVNAINITDD